MQIMQKVIQLCHMFKLFSVCFIRNVHILRNKTGEKKIVTFIQWGYTVYASFII